ncbi:hypothetical protein FRC11_000482 [Ceratobasidium sp. 423]|nr:hypothetical protein FRC11_000482 [Ceratobasidium sp. 423]
MQNYAIANNLTPFISMQNHYSLVYREEEREMMPTLKINKKPKEDRRTGKVPKTFLQLVLTCAPRLIGGYGKAHEGNNEIVRRVEALAKKKNLTMAQVALAWVMSKDQVSAPVMGTTNLSNLEELVTAVNIKLDEEEVKYLEEPYAPQAIFGHS